VLRIFYGMPFGKEGGAKGHIVLNQAVDASHRTSVGNERRKEKFLQERIGTEVAASSVMCLDSDDVEDFLVEEGIGHLNRYGDCEYGPSFTADDIEDLAPGYEHTQEKL
jgi:hypothetical protein